MVTEGNTCLQKALSSVLTALILMATAGQCALLASHNDSAANSTLDPLRATLLINETSEEPRVLRMHRPCQGDHLSFCANDGECFYPQEDMKKPSCICTRFYSGHRCMLTSGTLKGLSSYEEIIGVSVGVAMSIIFLIIVISCGLRLSKRCTTSAALIKPNGSLNSV